MHPKIPAKIHTLLWKEVLAQVRNKFSNEYKWLIEAISGESFTKIICNINYPLSVKQKKRYQQIIKKRASGTPLAYILKSAPFCGYDFYVNKSVLVPREDSEILVNWVIETAKHIKAQKLLELGIGSGALLSIVSMGLQKSTWGIEYFGSDISRPAIYVSKKNLKKYHIQARILHGDWLMPFNKNPKFQKYFNLIFANPPYIAKDDPHLQEDSLIAEPKLALTDGENGLKHLTQIISSAPKYLVTGGYLGVEHGFNQDAFCQAQFKKNQFIEIETLYDNAGLARITVGKTN